MIKYKPGRLKGGINLAGGPRGGGPMFMGLMDPRGVCGPPPKYLPAGAMGGGAIIS
jgi:hypothetical protein